MVDSAAHNDIEVFDKRCVRRNRARAANNFGEHDFLFRWAVEQISDRLMDVNRRFDRALQIGSRAVISDHPKIENLCVMDITSTPVVGHSPYIQGSPEFLPVGGEQLDLIVSILDLHSVNDLPGALIQIRRALKPDGLFIGCLPGGETLYELRDVLTKTELDMFGGISPRVFPFADKPQMGDLLQRAGFALPVVDSEIVRVDYSSAFKLFSDLRGMGEGNAITARDKRYMGKDFFVEAARRYMEEYGDADGRITASFEIIFLIGWAPHESQQKPLRPGSAEKSLAEALGSREIKTGEKSTP